MSVGNITLERVDTFYHLGLVFDKNLTKKKNFAGHKDWIHLIMTFFASTVFRIYPLSLFIQMSLN